MCEIKSHSNDRVTLSLAKSISVRRSESKDDNSLHFLVLSTFRSQSARLCSSPTHSESYFIEREVFYRQLQNAFVIDSIFSSSFVGATKSSIFAESRVLTQM